MILDIDYLESGFSEGAKASLDLISEGDDLASGAIDSGEQQGQSTHDHSSSEVDYAKNIVDGKDEIAAGPILKMGATEIRKSITRATRQQRLGGIKAKDYYFKREDGAEDTKLPTGDADGPDTSTDLKVNQSGDPIMNKMESHIYSMDDDSYLYSEAYEQYLSDCIDNEFIIKDFIFNRINESVQVLNEAEQLRDTVAKKFDGFMQFVDKILDRFWKAIDNISNSKRKYLEKYKDIILNKEPKDTIQITYTGDYAEGMSRCQNIQMIPFNYEAHADALRADGYKPILDIFMSGKNFQYNEGDDVAKDFKKFFMGVTDLNNPVESTVKLSNYGIKMQTIYDWLYNYQNLANVVKRDRANLGQSRNAIINAINEVNRENGEKTQTNQTENPTAQSAAKPATGQNTDNGDTGSTGGQINTQESAYYDSSSDWISLNEADEKGGDDNDKPADASGVTITNTADGDSDGNGSKDKEQKKEKVKTADQDMNNITKKWIDVCRAFCTGKLTAIQQISKDFMDMVTAHVKSYDGTSPKQDENNKEEAGNNPQGATDQAQNNNQQK